MTRKELLSFMQRTFCRASAIASRSSANNR